MIEVAANIPAKDAQSREIHSAQWLDWLPLPGLPFLAALAGSEVPAWVEMWALAFALYAALKWLTWRKWHWQILHARWRSVAYLLAWPGMDAKSFLRPDSHTLSPGLLPWLEATAVTGLGAALFCFGAPTLPAVPALLQGWMGMVGLIMMLHFGSFKLLALFWQSQGVNAVPIMSSPFSAGCLSEFWGRRWNLGFRDLAHQFVFVPVRKKLGVETASFAVFIISGLIHDLVISMPARGGYGLPTLYFAIQGIATAVERSKAGKRLGLRQGFRGRLYAITVAVVPISLLFHPPFVLRVVIPCMKAVHAL